MEWVIIILASMAVIFGIVYATMWALHNRKH